MNLLSKTITLFVVLSCTCSAVWAQLSITPETNATALAQKLVGNGVVISNATLTADPRATGFFNNLSGTQINIDSGIVLTNGRAKTEGINWGLDGNQKALALIALADLDQFLPGDGDIAQLLGVPRTQTHDACVLEFDFIALGDSIKFNYVFSSEEYTSNYVCVFNDAFAFFISGPGIPGLKNIALIPNSNTPVSIFNVNDVQGGTCPNNIIYFTDNISNRNFTHDGHTVVLTALEKVQPCQTYHLKLVITDVGDGSFDSGVFLEARSLSSNAVTIQSATQVDQQSNNYIVEGCTPGSFKIKRPKAANSPLNVTLFYGGTAVNGTDVQLLPLNVTIPANASEVIVNVIPIVDNIPEGIETIKIYALAGSACGPALPADSAIIQIRDYDTLGIIPDTAIICKNTPVQLMASAGYATYQWEANPDLNNNAIRDPVALPSNAVTTYYCTATIGSCTARDSALIIFKDLELISKKEINCNNYLTGEIHVSGGSWWTGPVQYAINNWPYQTDSSFVNLAAGSYTIKIKDAVGCTDSLVIILKQVPELIITGMPVTPASCSGNADGTVTVLITGGTSPYLFSGDGILFQSNNVLNLAQGSYNITVKDINSCVTTQNAIVPLNNTLTINAGIDTTICEGKSAQMNVLSNAAAFTWSPASRLNNPVIPNPVASPIQTTVYYVTGTTGICSKTDAVTIFVNPAPNANAGPDKRICYGKDAQIEGSGGLLYRWYPGSYLDDRFNASPTVKQLPASISYFLSVTDDKGCVSLKNDTVMVTVTRPAIVNSGRDTVLAIGQPLPLFATDVNNIGFIQYQWTPGYGLNNANIVSPLAIPDKDIIYTVTASNSIGCTAKDEIKIKVYRGPDIYVPNAFSPNGDGRNDILKAIPAGIKDFHYFRIFNRWGNIVFSTSNPSYGWDGKFKNTEQYPGTFIWMAEGLDYKGNTVQRKGPVMIIR